MLQDNDGVTIFPPWGAYGHFVFTRMAGTTEPRPYLAVAEIERCPEKMHKLRWKARMRKAERAYYNAQVSFSIDAIPALIATLSKAYEDATAKSAPRSGQVFVKFDEQAKASVEADNFIKGSSEF
jgi:hypothetical protein